MCARRYGISLRVLDSRYLFEQEKSSSISTCNRLLFCLLYKSRGPLPIRKIDSINVERNIWGKGRIHQPDREVQKASDASADGYGVSVYYFITVFAFQVP